MERERTQKEMSSAMGAGWGSARAGEGGKMQEGQEEQRKGWCHVS